MHTVSQAIINITSPILPLGRFSPEKWILTTYADQNLVVARDNFGGLVVLEREVAPAPTGVVVDEVKVVGGGGDEAGKDEDKV